MNPSRSEQNLPTLKMMRRLTDGRRGSGTGAERLWCRRFAVGDPRMTLTRRALHPGSRGRMLPAMSLSGSSAGPFMTPERALPLVLSRSKATST